MIETPNLSRLLAIMARLRDPDGGCPWDRAQSFATIAPYTIEEAYEVAEAIAEDDRPALREELGDLLFQIVFHARLAEEDGSFDFDAVAGAIADKMVRRHPHVFAAAPVGSAEAQSQAWEEHKAAERIRKTAGRPASALDGVALALPALSRAGKIQARAARVGFDWPAIEPVLGKIDEELAELRAELPAAAPERLEDELGDLLFAAVNLARHLKIDPEVALKKATRKFERRFHRIEARLAEAGGTPQDASLEELEEEWQRAKAAEA